MIRSAFVAALVAAAGSAGAEVYRDTAVAMQPVGQLDLDRYLGKWYEIARFPNSFETGCQGVTAEYALRGDGKVRVVNTCHTGAVDGPVGSPQGESPYHLVATLSFASMEALQAAMASPEGQKTAADLANFADGGAEILIINPRSL